ncbi:hypothetical protein DL766_001752 [Monosporascus sp. MC13-8B]|uniref:Heme haloperoxidase family profile domain-containing protein n=1 Tax=Monosporascus cannonballus TaxID=155416 RepID=A0ABY0HHX1_9PEZI|nr:hypothetical protein DL762_001710 [Monosporascus cannonballus]RYO99431.1 hypothetical protein DL763_001455 [Monosporascus cannonballus]RYP36874.1 hypothetical protein DL766_001752 [Monosporascus sp. MC13-8B]
MRAFTVLSLIATVAALPQGPAATPFSVKPWVAPGLSDSRGPCPMLNTLANHGYLSPPHESPHDGRNLTIQDFGAALHEGLNLHVSFGAGLAAQAFQLLGADRIDLVDLNTPEVTEHQASLTRNDHSSGDSLRLDPGRLEALLADSDTDYLDVASMARSRVRVEELSGRPPLSALVETQAAGEVGLLLLAMSDGPISEGAGVVDLAAAYGDLRAPKDRVAAWLTKEELPVAQGWRPAAREMTLADLLPLTLYVKNAKGALLSG